MEIRKLEVTRIPHAGIGAAKIWNWVDFRTTAVFVYAADDRKIRVGYNVSERAAMQSMASMEIYANLYLLAAFLVIEDGTSGTNGTPRTDTTRQVYSAEPFRAELTVRPLASDGKEYTWPGSIPEGVVPASWLE